MTLIGRLLGDGRGGVDDLGIGTGTTEVPTQPVEHRGVPQSGMKRLADPVVLPRKQQQSRRYFAILERAEKL